MQITVPSSWFSSVFGYLSLFRGGLLHQLSGKFLEFRTFIFDGIVLLSFDGEAHHVGRDGGAVAFGIAALDFLDGLDRYRIKTAFGFKQHTLGSKNDSALLLGADDFYILPGLQHQLQPAGIVSLFVFAVFPQGRLDQRHDDHHHRRGHKDCLPGDHGMFLSEGI